MLVLSNVRGVPSAPATSPFTTEDSASLDALSNVGCGVALEVGALVRGAVLSVLDGSGSMGPFIVMMCDDVTVARATGICTVGCPTPGRVQQLAI